MSRPTALPQSHWKHRTGRARPCHAASAPAAGHPFSFENSLNHPILISVYTSSTPGGTRGVVRGVLFSQFLWVYFVLLSGLFFFYLYTKSSFLFALCDELAHGLSSVEAIECRRLQKSTNPVEQDQESFASGRILPLTVQSKSFSSHFAGTASAVAKAHSPCQEGVPGRGGSPRRGLASVQPCASHALPPPRAGSTPLVPPAAGGSCPLACLMFYARKYHDSRTRPVNSYSVQCRA